jgi:hypothetical protein
VITISETFDLNRTAKTKIVGDDEKRRLTSKSAFAYGSALMQKVGRGTGVFKAIAFTSRSLSAAERKWPVVQCELATIVMALRTFKPCIYMSKIYLHTDHKPLTHLMDKLVMHPNLARWLMEIQNYDPTIVHIPGDKNKVADALSR